MWLREADGELRALEAREEADLAAREARALAKRGAQLGGLSAPRLLRMVGKDTWVATDDVVAALKAQGIIDKAPTSQRDQAAVQTAFNQWHAESGRPLCQLSMMLAYTVNH